MLQAVKTFRAYHEGEWIRIISGMTRLDHRHPLAKQYPDAFKPVAGTRRGGRWSEASGTASAPAKRVTAGTASRLATEVSGLESWRIARSSPRCQILYRTSPLHVRFAHDVRADVANYFEIAGSEREAACLLFGHFRDGLIEVTRFDHCSIGDDRTVVVNYGLVDRDNEVTAHGDVFVGCCHSQTGGFILASSVDADNWAIVRRALGMSAYVGIVATRTRARWEFAAWIVRFADASYDVAERAML
jgi:hypothetical protein